MLKKQDDSFYFDGADAASLGPKFTEFKNDPEGAIEHLLREKTGDAVAVWTRPEIGRIDLIYGSAKGGLAHIQSRHPEGLAKLPALLKRGRVVKDKISPRTVYLVDDKTPNHVTVIKLDWYGEQKSWVLTSYDDEDGRLAKRIALIDTESSTKKLDATGMSCRPGTLRGSIVIAGESAVKPTLDDAGAPDVAAMMARLKLTSELGGLKKQIDATGAGPLDMLAKLKLTSRANEVRKLLGANKPAAAQDPEQVKTLREVIAGTHDSKGLRGLYELIQDAINGLEGAGLLLGGNEALANDAVTHWAEMEGRLNEYA